jgi:hypothetical protein
MNITLSNTIKTIASCALLIRASAVLAHDGHGLDGSHWHSTDVAGFVALAVVAALAVWFTRGGK